MRKTSFVLASILLSSASVRAQDEEPAASSRPPVAPAALPTTAPTCIPYSLEVAAFTPPPPPVVKQVPAMRVDSAVTIPTKNGRTLTLIRGEASTMPDLPTPPVPQIHEARALTPAEHAGMAASRRHMLSMSATIFDHKASRVTWRHPDTGEFYEALCGFDVGLLAGVNSFRHGGESYRLMLMHFDLDTTIFRQRVSNLFPSLPAIPADSITILKGNPQDPIGTAPITVLKDIIASEKSRLVPYQASRRAYQQASAAWHKANPPIPRDQTYWFKPHRGSRYLKPTTEGGDQ